MNTIEVNGAGKSYYRSWLFKDVNLKFDLSPSQKFAFLGNNGSGKSTFLLMLCGQISPTTGNILWNIDGNFLKENVWHQNYALSSPGMELPEELNLYEWFSFIQKIKPLKKGIELEYIAEICKFSKKTLLKPIANYSSGMKQRVKLCGNLLSAVPVSFLDEPLSNLDADGIELYHKLIEMEEAHRSIFIASNDEKEYDFVSNRYKIKDKQIIQV